MSTHSLLRAATAINHAAVDEAFSAYDLSEVCSYRDSDCARGGSHPARAEAFEQRCSSTKVDSSYAFLEG